MVDPESEEINTIFEGGDSVSRLTSFCAQMIGPIVFVCKWRANSEKELCKYSALSAETIRYLAQNSQFGCTIWILEYASIEDNILDFQATSGSLPYLIGKFLFLLESLIN